MTGTLSFEPRELPSPESLSALQRAQVDVAGARYDGEDWPAEERIAPGDEEGAFYQPSCWALVDEGGVARFDLWLYSVDSGTMFHAGTADVAADLIQFGFEYPQDRALWAAIADAAHRARAEHPEWAVRQYDFSLGEAP